ncbi:MULTISPECIES: hypothetical protein [Myxococcaceae]|uniref:hypothetical protein n=1 Tax=Myxococcaceae TaxID=31 RepID=UPI00188FBCE7|nr:MULTISPECIES: hypothetical protein [Myxococcaceae]MBF5043147.1 hypothetical protein [Simulacricoccus sp. 17bor-14]
MTSKTAAATPSHPWRFFRAGGFDQVRLDTGADLLALGQLDQKLWVALACPTATLDIDPRTLRLLDTDGDGRIRAVEVIAACEWIGRLLKNPDDLLRGAEALPLSAVDTRGEEGRALAEAMGSLLRSLGKTGADSLSVADASEAVQTLNQAPLNGDGLLTEASSESAELQAALRDALECLGGEQDRSGKPGVGQAKLDLFFSELDAWARWRAEGEADPQVMVLGEATAAAREQLRALEAKVEDYFARCRIAAFDPRAAHAMNRDDKDYAQLSARELSLAAQELASFPLALVAASQPLPLVRGLNPAWADAVAQLRAGAVVPLLGEREQLTEAEWRELRARFAPFDAWLARKQGATVEKLGAARIAALRASDAHAELTRLVAADLAVEPVARSLASIEKLVRLHRDLYRLCNNFVSFREFYARKGKATFQAGTLYIDQRSCDLCIQVTDLGKHAALAPLARSYLVYCECARNGQKMTIAAAFTAGDSETLMVGRNGVFYDRQGRDWDATIVRIVDNPISVRQAFWAPYKKLVRFIEEQVAKRASDADSAANARLTSAATDVGSAAAEGKAREEKPKLDIGIVAALGVAVGGISAALGAMMQAFFGLGIWMPLGFVALLFAISGPSMAIAWLKLRQRNLAPLLDANGWAMNSPARINIPFGSSLTQVAALPAGAARELKDPYAEPHQPWGAYAAGVAVAALAVFWLSGHADPFLPERARRATVWAQKAPASAPAAPAAAAAKATANAPVP